MVVFRRFGRHIRDAAKSIIRNFSLSISSISCITITLIVVSLSIILSYNVENFTESIRKDVTIVIFLDSSVNQERIDEIKSAVYKTNNVYSLTFKSKKETALEMKKENEIFGKLLDGWGENANPLLDSFMLKVNDIGKINETVKFIEKQEGINNINYGEKIISQLIVVFDVVRKCSIGAVVALILVTAFLITNTIKLTIYSRKTEIEIMRLVGASNPSIKLPFIIEGLFLGLFGSVIPVIITTYGYVSLYSFFDGKVFNSSLAKLIKPFPFVYNVSLILILIGILVGMVGSYRAVKKYLKI